MKIMKYRAGYSILPAVLIITITACSMLFPVQINKILENPRDYADKQVTISGMVVDTFSLVVMKYFTIRDDTGEMMVITQRPMPARGAKIKVTGTVQEAFSLGDERFVVLIERNGTRE